jgi:hypothetical protein
MRLLKFPVSFFLYLLALVPTGFSQDKDVSLLFRNEEPIAIRLEISLKEVQKETNDTTYLPTKMAYKTERGVWDSLKIDLRARGEFRRNNCFFPPIRIKMKKKHTKETLFEGNKNLKLVIPCQNSKNADDLLLKEYLAYQLYEEVSPYVFSTRMVNLTLIDNSGRQPREYQLKGFFIEDDGLVAKRFNAEMVKDIQIHPMRMMDTVSTTHDFFEFMIANTDWSSVAQHNVKVMQLENKDYVPLPYDFDMTGLVNPPYAEVNEMLNISNIQERVYRGFCRSEDLFQAVRQKYIDREAEIMAVFESEVFAAMNPKELLRAKAYIEEFFEILHQDERFNEQILTKCRLK